MADFYSSSEIGLVNGGIREGGYGYNRRNEIEGFRSLSHSHDHGLSIRASDTSSRFEWNSLMNDSRGGSRSNGVRDDTRVRDFVSRGENYDEFPVERDKTRNVISYDPIVDELIGGSRSHGVRDELVDRSLPLVSERTRNVPAYGHNVGGSEYREEARNVIRVPIDDGRDYSVREREYPLERELVSQPYNDEMDLGFHSGDGSHSLTPRSLNNGHRTSFQGIANEGDYSVREREYPPRLDRVLVRQPYDDDSGLRFCHEEGSHSLTPRSQSSGHHTPFQGIANEDLVPEVQYRSSNGIGSGSRFHPSRSSRYHRTPYSNTGGISHHFTTEAISPRGEYAPSVRKADDYINPDGRRSRIYRETVSEDIYDNDHSVHDYNDQGGTFGIEAGNATLPGHHYDGYSNRNVVIEDEFSGRQNISPPPQVVYGEVNIRPMNSYPDHSREEICGSLPREEQFSYKRNASDMSYEGQYVHSPRRNDRVPLMDTRDFHLPEQPYTTRKRMHETVDEMCDAKHRMVSTRGSRYDRRHLSVENEGELGLSSRITRHHDEPYSRAHIGMSLERPLSKPQDSDRGDIKKRLIFPPAVSRPCAPQLPWKKEVKSRKTSSVKPFGKVKGTDFKKKLKSVPKEAVCQSVVPDTVVLDSGLNIKKQKVTTKDSGIVNDALCSQAVHPHRCVLKVKPLEELREDSVKFKQQVDEWFLRCIWHLFGNICCQKRFNGQGNGGGLKCIICPPSSKVFAQTKDVAMHAFSSPTNGYRAQHLGFHRALCALMGWDRAVIPNCRWVCKPLPELVAWNLKEDIIIWPPVVIIHNNPATDHQLNEPGKVSIGLANFLRDNGFTSEIQSHHENPGNPNMMVVKFKGTLPGFKEAERLHKFFAGNKHGRVELAQIDAEVVCCKLLYKKPEDALKLVDEREDDQKPIDKIKDEQPEYKTGDCQMIVDKMEDDDKPLGKTNVDQQLVVTARAGKEPIDIAQDNQTPVIRVQDDQTPVITAQDNHTAVVTAQDDQTPAVTGQDDQTLVVTALDDQTPAVISQDDNTAVVTAQDTKNLVVMAKDDQTPLVTAQDDQEPIVTSQDDQEPMVMTQNDQEPMVMAQDGREPVVDHAPVGETEDDQAFVNKTNKVLLSVCKISNCQAPLDKKENDPESFDKAEYDQKPVGKAKDDQEPVGEAKHDQEPVGKAKDDQEPVGKAKDDQEPVSKAKDDQEPVGETNDTLYGYLGIIEDLNILHLEIMSHHCARSKKEILAFL